MTPYEPVCLRCNGKNLKLFLEEGEHSFFECETCQAEALTESQSNTQLVQIIEDIDQELSDPRQQVKNIFDCVASESELRKYLHHLSEHLKVFASN